MKAIIDEGYETAVKILKKHNKDFERLAQGLLEYETLTGDEITKVINGLPLDHEDDDDSGTPASGGKASLAAIPKTKKPKTPKDPGMEPEPSA